MVLASAVFFLWVVTVVARARGMVRKTTQTVVPSLSRFFFWETSTANNCELSRAREVAGSPGVSTPK